MAAAWKRPFSAGSLLILLVLLFNSSCFGSGETVFGPQEFMVSPLHVHLSYNTFSVNGPCEGVLLTVKEKKKKISGGYVLLNERIISLQDFLSGNEEVFEERVELKSWNYLTVFLSGTPGAVVSLEIRTISSPIHEPEVEFTAEPQVIDPGGTTTLRWTTAYAETVWIDHEIGYVEKSGYLGVSPGETTEYRLTAEGQGGATTKSVRVEVRGGFSIFIASPSEGETINGSHVPVKGTLDLAGGSEAGVNVNGILALVHGQEFVANGVPLQDGENVIKAVAVDGSGNRAEASVTVYAQIGQGDVRIKAEPDSGIAPFESILTIESLFSLTDPSFSYVGPGVVEFAENSGLNSYGISIGVPGLYTITLEARDDEGRVYTDSVTVLVNDGEVLETVVQEEAFLKEHLGLWVHDFCARVERHALTDFYRGFSVILDAFMDMEKEWLRDLLQKIR